MRSDTNPDRMYVYAATSLGVADNNFRAMDNFNNFNDTIFLRLTAQNPNLTWKVYRQDGNTSSEEQTVLGLDFYNQYSSHFAYLSDYKVDAAGNTLPSLAFFDLGGGKEHPE